MVVYFIFLSYQIHYGISDCCIFRKLSRTNRVMRRLWLMELYAKSISYHEHSLSFLRHSIVCCMNYLPPNILITDFLESLFYFFNKASFIQVRKSLNILHKEEFWLYFFNNPNKLEHKKISWIFMWVVIFCIYKTSFAKD